MSTWIKQTLSFNSLEGVFEEFVVDPSSLSLYSFVKVGISASGMVDILDDLLEYVLNVGDLK